MFYFQGADSIDRLPVVHAGSLGLQRLLWRSEFADRSWSEGRRGGSPGYHCGRDRRNRRRGVLLDPQGPAA